MAWTLMLAGSKGESPSPRRLILESSYSCKPERSLLILFTVALLLFSPPSTLSAQETTSRSFELFLHEKDTVTALPWTKEDFVITINKKPFDGIVSVEKIDAPLRIIVLMDTSGSSRSYMGPLSQLLASDLKNHLRAGDQVAVLALSESLMLAADFTSDQQKIGNAILSLQVEAGSKIHDSLIELSEKLKGTKRSDVIVLFFSDGSDNLSERSWRDAANALVSRGIRMIAFCIDVSIPGRYDRGCANLRRISRMTGGKELSIDSKTALAKAMQQFSLLRDSRYSLKLTVPGHVDLKDVKIKSRRPKSEVLYAE